MLWGLLVFHQVRGELQTTRELTEQFLSLAQSVQDPELLLLAHYGLGATLTWLGEFAPAREHLQQSIALYDSQHHYSHTLLYGQDPGPPGLSFAAWALWFLGYPDQALKKSHEALTLARELAHPLSSAYTLDFAALFHQFRREGRTAQEQAEAAIRLCTEQGLPFLLACGTIYQGYALAEQGQEEEGITQMRQGLAAYRATEAELNRTSFLALLAEAYGKAGQVEKGLNTLAEALAAVDKTGERFYEAELYRLKGELTLSKGARDWRLGIGSSFPQAPSLKPQVPREVAQEAEGYFLTAIEIACKQQAKSLELRATMSLARLWRQQGKAAEAHQMLVTVYNWFTEGFDIADLQDAKRLIEELS